MVGVTILRGFNVSLGPLVLSAGIAGVALGFGAQTLVRDTISGLFIVLERQYDIGDVVDLETDGGLVSGTVEGLSLRITSVRQFDGTLSIAPIRAPDGTLPDMPELSFADVDDLQDALAHHAYLADRGLTTAIYLGLSLGKPLLLEGEAGVGKTEVAKVLAELLGRRLIRLQCYEGIDASQALYEWNYARQLIAVRAMDATDAEAHVEDLFGPEFLVERPLLAAIRAGDEAVLLVDELDRADDEFEAFLLEILSEFAVTIPEIGRVGALTPPAVIVTSNRTRELHDALKRRCLYHWIDHPDLDREVDIVRARAPHVGATLARDVAQAG